MLTTNRGLLQRLQEEGAEAAWAEFFGLYGPAIVRYGRRLGLNEEESKDLLQTTMVDLVRILPDFEYQPERGRFRSFLFTIVHRKACAHWRREHRRVESNGALVVEDLMADPATDPEVIARWRESLLDAALEDLRRAPGISARDLAIFIAYAVEGQEAEAVAAQFGIKENNLYQIKARLLKRLRARADWLWRYMD